MGFGTGFAIYFIIWWMVLFISLPFRMKPQFETGEVVDGTEPAAPQDPQILKRFAWNTVLSGVVFFLFWFVVYYLDIDVNSFPEFFPIRVIHTSILKTLTDSRFDLISGSGLRGIPFAG